MSPGAPVSPLVLSDPWPIDDAFDAAFADALARRESFNKHLYRPNTYLHKWWARRCGTTFRAILKHLIRDPERRDFYAPGGLEGQIILDPLMGGGTTLHEALRLGANAIGADLDPIPVLQARATLTQVDPRRAAQAFEAFYTALRGQLAEQFVTHCPTCAEACDLRFVLYGAQRLCGCGGATLIDDLALRHNSDGSVWRIEPERGDVYCDGRLIGAADRPPERPLRPKAQTVCPSCEQPYREETALPYYRRYAPLAVAGECPRHGFFFAALRAADWALIEQADAQRAGLFDPADFAIAPGPKSADLLRRGVANYLDLFTSRQLLYLRAAVDALPTVDAAVRLKLGLLVSTSLEFNALLCGYKGGARSRPGAIRHVFAHHAYALPYTALENNPLYPARASGTLQALYHQRIARGAVWAARPIERRLVDGDARPTPIEGEVDAGVEVETAAALATGRRRFLLIQGSSAHLPLPDASVDHVITDPPYYDSVQYGDLAAFFRVWLQQLLPQAADWHYALETAAVDQQRNGNGDAQYVEVLSAVFSECRRVLRQPHGRLIFTFHHWDALGWAMLTEALQRAGFRLINRYVIHAEHTGSVHIANQKALVHDVVLVLAPRETDVAVAWPRPDAVDRSDSYRFVEQCGALLGYLLNSEHNADDVRAAWSDWSDGA